MQIIYTYICIAISIQNPPLNRTLRVWKNISIFGEECKKKPVSEGCQTIIIKRGENFKIYYWYNTSRINILFFYLFINSKKLKQMVFLSK